MTMEGQFIPTRTTIRKLDSTTPWPGCGETDPHSSLMRLWNVPAPFKNTSSVPQKWNVGLPYEFLSQGSQNRLTFWNHTTVSSPSCGGWKSEIKVCTGLVSTNDVGGKSVPCLSPGFQCLLPPWLVPSGPQFVRYFPPIFTFLLTVFSLCVCVQMYPFYQ